MVEIDRLTPQNNEMGRKVRDMESHIESYTRAEIKSVYSAARDAEMRLFMMQRQLEQLEYKLRNLRRYEKQLRAVVEAVGHLPEPDAGAEQLQAPPPENEAVGESLAELIFSRDAERQKVTRRLHDGPAQSLANLILRSEICERLLAVDPADAKTELADIRRSIARALDDTRNLIFELRPMILDDLGPMPTLRRYTQALADKSGATINLTVSGTETRLPYHAEIALFSVIQEALMNSIQHGHSTHVETAVSYHRDRVTASVEDNGSGFDTSAALPQGGRRQRTGISSMRHLVAALSGSLAIESEPGKGTTVTADIPIVSDGSTETAD
jgi:two-component system, NarL family, sensor histidine kinase DegS